MLEVAPLLRRLGLDEPPAPDVAGLWAVHRAFVATVPYEDLAVQLGEAGPLKVPALGRQMLRGGRGGYCFELNGVLGALLEALGFTVRRHRGVVGVPGGRAAGDPVNHLVLVVDAGGSSWVADAGLGEGWLDPLALEPGTQGTDALRWTLDREDDGGWWIAHHEWGSFQGVSVDPEPVGLDAFHGPHRRLSTDPSSSFVQTLVVQRPYDDHVVTLRARTLRADGPAHGEQRVLDDVDDLARTLDGVFGIDPGALGQERLGRLWGQACAQHEAWLSGQAALAGDAEA